MTCPIADQTHIKKITFNDIMLGFMQFDFPNKILPHRNPIFIYYQLPLLENFSLMLSLKIMN